VRNDSLGIPLVVSLAVHASVVVLGAAAFQNAARPKDFLPIHLVDLPRPEAPPPRQKFEAPREIKKPAPPPLADKPVRNPPPVPREPERVVPEPLAAEPALVKPEPQLSLPPEAVEAKPPRVEEARPAPAGNTLAGGERAPHLASSRPGEGGGSEAGAGNLFDRGDVAVVPGRGTAGGGGGTAASGLGRGSGAPGLPAPPVILRTNREARPIQTARAQYPPIALRAGLESDVTLKIEVDPQGNVTRAEISKSGGAGFDEEALKAVKQSRFQPAQREGRNVPAEFTYVYRFRLRK
jgi:TonB family protein